MSEHNEHFQYRTRHPDEVFFDKITISQIDRWKTSGLSGDEWRFSQRIELWRRGRVLYRRDVGNHLETAFHIAALADSPASLDASDAWTVVEPWDWKAEEGTCNHPGCAAPAVVRAAMIRVYDRSCSISQPAEGQYREFCATHRHRGDCGLDDADANYQHHQELPARDLAGTVDLSAARIPRPAVFGGKCPTCDEHEEDEADKLRREAEETNR